MFKILDKRNGEVTAEQQAVFNKISTNNADGYVDGFLNSLRIAKMSSNVISVDSGLLSIQGFRSVNDTLTTYTVSVTPSEPIPFQLVATYSHYISDENDTLEITTRPTQELRREPLFAGQNAVYEVELAEFNMTADGITDFAVTLEKIVYNEQDLSELLDKVTKAEQDSATALEKVNELETQVIEKQGTAVYVGGTAQSRVNFASDPQTQITEAQSDISDIIDGSQTVGKAKQDANGNVIDTTYAKLSQVVRVDAEQSLTDEEKTRAKYNVAVAVDGGKTVTGTIGWYNVAKYNYGNNTTHAILMTIVQTHYSQGYQNIKLLINTSDENNFVITQLSGTLGSTSASQLDKVRIRIVDDTAYIDIHQQNAVFNRNTIYFEDLQSDEFRDNSTYFLQTVDFELVNNDTGVIKELSLVAGFATTGDIYSKGSPVLAGFDSPKLSGTSGSVKLPGRGWYCINYKATSLVEWYSTGVFYWGGEATYLPVSAYRLSAVSIYKRAVNISSNGTVTVFDPDSGTNYTDFTVEIYKLT